MTGADGVRGRLFIVSAPSGAGKTSLTHAVIDRLAAEGITVEFSISYTTRAPRARERDGVDYHFIDEPRFRQMAEAGEFLEHAQVFGRSYGTGRRETERRLAAGQHVVLDIDWQGARQVRERLGRTAVTSIFIQPPSRDELERRLRERGQDDDAAIVQRLAEADEDMSHAGEYDVVITNDDFDATVARLLGVFRRSILAPATHLT